MEFNFGYVEILGGHIGDNQDFLELECTSTIWEYKRNVHGVLLIQNLIGLILFKNKFNLMMHEYIKYNIKIFKPNLNLEHVAYCINFNNFIF